MTSLPRLEYKKQVYSNDNKTFTDMEKANEWRVLRNAIKKLIWESPTFILIVLTALSLALIYKFIIK